MKAYKFRGSDQIAFALDIIIKKRLFCAPWHQLNDPLEGQFTGVMEYGDKAASKHLEKVVKEKYRFRVCSLSKSYSSHLLWAHYATGFRGLAIEVELPPPSECIVEVEYRKAFELDVMFDSASKVESTAKSILSSKYREWEYEDEIRIIQKSEWYELSPPEMLTGIICGHLMDDAVFKTLQMLAKFENIPISKIRIGNSGITLIPDSSA